MLVTLESANHQVSRDCPHTGGRMQRSGMHAARRPPHRRGKLLCRLIWQLRAQPRLPAGSRPGLLRCALRSLTAAVYCTNPRGAFEGASKGVHTLFCILAAAVCCTGPAVLAKVLCISCGCGIGGPALVDGADPAARDAIRSEAAKAPSPCTLLQSI